MAIHTVYASINEPPGSFREQLLRSLISLGWEHIPKSDNYYRLRIINRDVYEKLHTVPAEEFTGHGLSDLRKWYHQSSGKLISGLSGIANRIGFLKKAVEATEDLMKNVIDHTRDEYFYPDLLIMPQEEGIEIILSHKSNEKRSDFIILTYLVLKHELLAKKRLAFTGYDYHRKEKKSTASISPPPESAVPGSTAPPAGQAPSSPEAAPPEGLANLVIALKTNLSENRIKDCFQELDGLYQKVSSDQYEAYTVLKSEYNRMKQDTIAGILSYENAELKRNQINHRLLLLIDELEEDGAIRGHFLG
jgi:hypothetical protein